MSSAPLAAAGQGGAVLPRHVAIIMDGNGRWAKQRHLPRVAGHRAGVEAVRKVTRAARAVGIEALTLYAFSSENWRRPDEEVGDLMGLLRLFIRSDLAELVRENVRLQVIGDYRRFPTDVVALINDALARTAANSGPILAIALNYGAQAELVEAARRLSERAVAGTINPAAIDAAAIEAELETRALPPLDLLIRTSGEHRLSNFLLWQAAYAELLFVDTLWPDFDGNAFVAAIDDFGRRQRRFWWAVNGQNVAGHRTPSNLRLRMIASVAMIAVAIAAVAVGGVAFWLLAVVVAILMMAEWAELVGASAGHKRLAQYALSVPLAIMAPIAAGPDPFALGLLIGAAFFVVIVTRLPWLAAGVLYCGLPVLALLLVDRQHEGLVWTLWTMALVWGCDIGAFFVGRTLGGPKLAPRLSPNKTWSGLIGGVVLASAVGALMHWRWGLPLRMTLATPALAVIAQGGDLFESWLKRRAGVKDSGTILPGHGGVLDRLDGLVPVAPLAALLVILPHFYPS